MTAKILRNLLLGSLVALASNAAMATTLTFDDIPAGGQEVPASYGGFTWNNWYVLDGTTRGGGYNNGVVSANNVAYNGGGSPASFSSGTAFTLNDAFFTAAWSDGLNVHVVGTGAATYTTDFVVNTTSPTRVFFNWTGLTSVDISTSGGTDMGLGGSGTHIALENLTVDETVAVPEPATLALMSLGLAGAGVFRRKAAKKA